MRYTILCLLMLSGCSQNVVGTLACTIPVGLVETKTNDERVSYTSNTIRFKGSQGTLEVPKAMCVVVYE